MHGPSFLERLVPDDGLVAYMTLILLCGVSMLFAIPFASHVSQHTAFRAFYAPSLFFLVYTFLMSAVGVHRGSSIARQCERVVRAVAALALQVLLAELLVLPYLIYIRAVQMATEPRIALISLYALIVAFLTGLGGYAVERRALAKRKPALLRKTVILLTYYAAPFVLNLVLEDRFALVALVSPVGAVLHILDRGSATATLVAFAIPLAMIALFLIRMRRRAKGESA